VLVEDSYEIDERYSVEECLGDMFPVTVLASIIEVKAKQIANNNQRPIK
jgi:hypothetical protein